MNEKDRAEILNLCRSIEKKEGVGSIYGLGSKKSVMNLERWSTGIEDLDEITGGGMPVGRMVEIFGPESCGKTSLALHLCSLHKMGLYIPVEGTFDAERAKIFGNDKGLIISRPEWGEDTLEQALKFIKANMPIIVIDSIPFLVPRAEYEKIEKDFNQELRIGGVARLMTKTMPALTKALERSNTTLIFINQVRDKMDAMMFGEKTQTPGGHSLKHAYSLRIQMARRSWIDVPNKNPKNSAATEKIGIISKVKVVKSKICNPYGEAELPMIFNSGYVSHDDVIEIRKEIMAKNRRKSKSKENEEEDNSDE